MKQMFIWVSAMRLRTLPLSISGIILAACFAHYNGVFEWRVFILAILTTLSFQILSNLSNDLGDGLKGTDNDDRIYGYKGLGDVFVFLFFGLVSVIGCYVLFAKQIDHVTILPALTIGLLSTGVLNLNNMRDRLTDKASGKITLAVKLGEKNVKTYHNILIIAAILLSLLYGILYFTSLYNLIFVVTYIPLLLHLKRVNSNSDPKLLDPELKKLALTTVLLAVLMGIGHLMPFW